MFDLLPNQHQGFARSGGEALHAHLWDKYLGGMTPCLGLGGRDCADVSPYRFDGTLVGSASALSVTRSPIGPAIRFNGNVAIQWAGHSALGNKFKIADGNGPVTIHAFANYVHKASATKMYLFRSDNQAVGQSAYGYSLYIEANSDELVFAIDRGGAADPVHFKEYKSGAGSLAAGKWQNLAVTYYSFDSNDPDVGQSVVMWIDGPLIYPSVPSTESQFAHRNADNSRCGAANGAVAPDMEVALMHLWNRRLAWGEIALLQADPMAMFRRAGGPADS